MDSSDVLEKTEEKMFEIQAKVIAKRFLVKGIQTFFFYRKCI